MSLWQSKTRWNIKDSLRKWSILQRPMPYREGPWCKLYPRLHCKKCGRYGTAVSPVSGSVPGGPVKKPDIQLVPLTKGSSQYGFLPTSIGYWLSKPLLWAVASTRLLQRRYPSTPKVTLFRAAIPTYQARRSNFWIF